MRVIPLAIALILALPLVSANWFFEYPIPPLVLNNNTNVTLNAVIANMFCDALGNCITNLTGNMTVTANNYFYINNSEHRLNGTNHTGNLSSMRVVKDSGTSFSGWLLDSIIDYFSDNYWNSTRVNEQIVLANSSMRDYVLWVNSTNGVGGGGGVSENPFNQTLNTTSDVRFNMTYVNKYCLDASCNVSIYKEYDYMVYEVTIS